MLLVLRYRLLCGLLLLLVRCGLDERDLETAVLRRQLKILARGGTRPRFTTADRAFLAAAARLLLLGPVEELPGRARHPPPVAPRALEEKARAPLLPPRSPPRSIHRSST